MLPLLFVALLTAGVPQDAWASLELPEATPRRLLIKKSVLLEGNEALVVSGDAAKRLYGLLRNNEIVQHTCAWHWSLTFEIADQRFVEVPFNPDCETFRRSNAEIQRLVRGYIDQIEKRPSHYLIELAFSPTEDVAPARRALEKAGYRVFLQPPHTALPRVRLETIVKGPVTDDSMEVPRRCTSAPRTC